MTHLFASVPLDLLTVTPAAVPPNPSHESLAKIVELLTRLIALLEKSEAFQLILQATYWQGVKDGALWTAIAALIAGAVIYVFWKKQ
ncbi:MAG: hypothetical protein RMJ19_05585 [Gemmatales bacterium]|nr:hypothetical protein [Gemmatales bacterium]MDW8175125.1 hypothetical protein [Gemmatales bacterium]